MVMMMMMIVTATIYCLDDGLRAFSLCQDPFALPLGGPHPAMGPRVALWSLGLLWLQGSAWGLQSHMWQESSASEKKSPYSAGCLSESGIQQMLTQTGFLSCFGVECFPKRSGAS